MAQFATRLGTQTLHLRLGTKRWVALSGQRLRIGRHPSNDLVLSDTRVSRFHAVVEWNDGRPVLHDNDSRNGTYVDGLRLEGSLPLETGQLVGLGAWDLTVELQAAPALLQEEEEPSFSLFTECDSDQLVGSYTSTQELHRALLGLEWEERTGSVRLGLGKVAGHLTLCFGRVVAAKLGRLEGIQALERMLRTSRGSYHFTPTFELSENNLDVSVRELLRDGFWEVTKRHHRSGLAA